MRGAGEGHYPAFWYRTLAGHETYTCSLHDELDLDSLERGRYQLVASLNTYGLTVHTRRPFMIIEG